MGILNVTPDSFYDGGRAATPARAVRRGLRLAAEGADLIDVGGESTRPGARRVSARQEIRRVIPVIEKLAGKLRVPISVDTSKAEVAEAALRAGARLINDVTALRDRRMRAVAARSGVPVILMHMPGTPRTMQRRTGYRRLIPEVRAALSKSAQAAMRAGVRRDRILIDPGIGFGKTAEQSLRLIRDLAAFRTLGFPIVVGPSRKSFIGRALDGVPAQERLFGTAAAVALCAAGGADIIRVHDVAAMRQVARVAAAVRNGCPASA